METGEILAASYSHFDSVQREKLLKDMFLGLIGVVKKTPRRFPMAYLQIIEFTCRGDCYVLVSEERNEGVNELLEFSWVDPNRQ